MDRLWQLGESVILRNTGLPHGEMMGTPHLVIEDRDEQTILFRPEGTTFAFWLLDEGRLKSTPQTRMDMLRFMWPGRGYAVELYFNTGRGPPYSIFVGEGRFRGWKVNVEAPFRRTEIGFDTTDRDLDIFVQPERTWYWADENDLGHWVKSGGYTQAESDSFYRDTKEAEELIKAALPPFDDSWINWQPPTDFGLPTLTDGWQLLDGAEMTSGTGRRYDAWRQGRDVAKVMEQFNKLHEIHHGQPESRRSQRS